MRGRGRLDPLYPSPHARIRSITQTNVPVKGRKEGKLSKTKLLYIGDYSNTGFGTVSKGLLRGLHATGEYEILQMGINWFDIDPFDEPWDIIPAAFSGLRSREIVTEDPYGFERVSYFLNKFDPDIVFINNDYMVARSYMVDDKGQPTRLANHRSIKVLYAPVDSEPVPDYYVNVAKMFDLNIAYTHWQRLMFAEHDPIFSLMPVLYHGYDSATLAPMDKTLAKQALVEALVTKNDGEGRELFAERILNSWIVYFVGANQFRKDIPCLFRAFAKLNEDIPEASLIVHANSIPQGESGWHLSNLQKLTGVERSILMIRANVYTPEEMNLFYNAADVLAYPTRGEGFGLPSLEAMAVKTPVAATAFGPQLELHNRGRGYLVDFIDVIAGTGPAWSYFVLPDYRSLHSKLKFIHDNPDHVAETVERAYETFKSFTWENQANQLHDILSKIPRNTDANDIQAQETD